MISRTSTFGLSQMNLGNINATQRNIQDLTVAISSGKKDNRYEGLASDSNRLVNLENELDRIDRYTVNIETAQLRLSTTETALDSIYDMAGDLRDALIQAANDPDTMDVPLKEIARNFYESAATFLNTEENDRYLFAGAKTNQAPVLSLSQVEASFDDMVANGTISLDTDYLAYPGVVSRENDNTNSMSVRTMQVVDFFTGGTAFNTTTGYPASQEPSTYLGSDEESNYTLGDPPKQVQFSNLYYQGDDTQLSVKAEDNVDVDYGVTAARESIEKLMAAAFIVSDWEPGVDSSGRSYSANGETLDNDTKLDAALRLVNESIGKEDSDESILQVRSEVGITMNRLSISTERHSTMSLSIEGLITEIENTDVAEAATYLADQRMILESSFLAISSLSQLSLANYMR